MVIPTWHCKNCGCGYTLGEISHPPLLQNLITTNNPPSETELVSVNEILPTATAQLTQELATLNDDIRSLQDTLEVLQARRAEVEARLRACKSIPSPFRRVPLEIVMEIINWATNGEPVSLAAEKGIWSYSRVSRMWRSVALSNPASWSTIHINDVEIDCDCARPPSDIQSHREHAPKRYRCVETILSRTRNHPISLSFLYEKNEYTQYPALKLLELFTRHAPQWHRVSLSVPYTSTFVSVLNSVKDRVGRLEDLFLDLYESDNTNDRVICFQNAPALCRVSFSSRLRHPDFLPWSQIKEYRADRRTVNGPTCLASLKLLPNLLVLELDGQIAYPYNPNKVELEKLRRLDFVRSGYLVQRLTLPALQEVTVRLENGELLALIDLIRRSECQITTLTLKQSRQDSIGDANILIQLFKCLPLLTVLNIFVNSQENATSICESLKEAIASFQTQ